MRNALSIVAAAFFGLCIAGLAQPIYQSNPRVNWPAAGGALISAGPGNNNPTAIAEVDGSCLKGVSSAWAAAACGAGTVTTTGSPASGNLAKFSGATSITNGDLSGDISTSGTLVTTIKTSISLPGSPTTTTQAALDNSTKIATTAYADALAAAFIAANHTYTAAQRAAVVALTISTATFTPNFDTGQNFTMTLIHASCPCTLANPSTTPVAGQSGVIEIIQSATGSDTIGTWGSNYTFAGGTSTISLSTGVSARDYLSYYVADSTHIVLSSGSLNATH